MIIILEGPEAAGKSMLAKRLTRQTGFPVVHRSKPKDEQEREEMMNMYVQAIMERQNVIFDRCWYSEMVYGEIMRDKSYIDREQMYKLEQLVSTNGGGIVIHCTDRVDKLWKRCKERGEDYVTDLNTLAYIKLGFECVLHELQHVLPVVRYELSKSSLPIL